MYKSKFLREKNKKIKKIKEGGGSGVEITLVDGIVVKFEGLFKNNKFKIKKLKHDPETEVKLSAYMWGKTISGKELFTINNPEEIIDNNEMEILNSETLDDILEYSNVEIFDLNGIDKYGENVNDLGKFLSDLEKKSGVKVHSIEGSVSIQGSWVEGGGYSHGSLGKFVNPDGNNITGDIYVKIYFYDYSQPIELQIYDVVIDQVTLNVSKYMQEAWDWCWNNWSNVESGEEDSIDQYEWEDAYN